VIFSQGLERSVTVISAGVVLECMMFSVMVASYERDEKF